MAQLVPRDELNRSFFNALVEVPNNCARNEGLVSRDSGEGDTEVLPVHDEGELSPFHVHRDADDVPVVDVGPGLLPRAVSNIFIHIRVAKLARVLQKAVDINEPPITLEKHAPRVRYAGLGDPDEHTRTVIATGLQELGKASHTSPWEEDDLGCFNGDGHVLRMAEVLLVIRSMLTVEGRHFWCIL